MKISLHAGSIKYTNILTDLRVAKDAGYYGIEMSISKVNRYLEAGYQLNELAGSLGPLRVTMLDVLLSIERSDLAFRRRLLSDCEHIAVLASRLRCPAIQVVALNDFDMVDWHGMRRRLIASLSELADIAAAHGVRLGLEPVSFSSFHTIPQALDVVHKVGVERVGLVLDTWHLWTGGTQWQQVADLDPDLVVCAHISDTSRRAGTAWSDDDRTALPGDGILPLRAAIEAIRSTGFDGVWAVEILSKRHWEWEPAVLANELLCRARSLLGLSSHRQSFPHAVASDPGNPSGA